jgi:hypothetical protein
MHVRLGPQRIQSINRLSALSLHNPALDVSLRMAVPVGMHNLRRLVVTHLDRSIQ